MLRNFVKWWLKRRTKVKCHFKKLCEMAVELLSEMGKHLQLNLDIFNINCLEFHAISNFFPGPFRIYGLPTYKISRYLQLFFWSLKSISVVISNFLEDVAYRSQPMFFELIRMLFGDQSKLPLRKIP